MPDEASSAEAHVQPTPTNTFSRGPHSADADARRTTFSRRSTKRFRRRPHTQLQPTPDALHPPRSTHPPRPTHPPRSTHPATADYNLWKFYIRTSPIVDCTITWNRLRSTLTDSLQFRGAAFWIDPLKNRIDPDVIEVVERSFNIMNKKKPVWRVVKCPKQSGVVECGYYVMRFMRDIIMSTSTSIIQIMKDSPRAYTQDDIDCIRSEWAELVGKHVDKGLNKAKGNPMAFYKVLPQSIGAMKPWIRQLVDV
ncbi:uncharacterized protein E6C27_scaffold1614G00250 [Cucumis melo var. makuwa]|uniref:Ubiquitin-like protease family profile domain-containing protein n=1 Tax=Cucumis melo var. makuwa TaxID=1194695 RepID=A0A5A7UH02_CUCMM|nr:uncharacterized protein E6C27_scaffold1614G00250 [Cucumis melo var. makuwa]